MTLCSRYKIIYTTVKILVVRFLLFFLVTFAGLVIRHDIHAVLRRLAQRQSARAHTAALSAFCSVFFVLLFCRGGEKNSFYGLLSSQLPCSRCSCRRYVLPPRRKKKKIKHRDQLICTVINRKETFERSARRGVNPGMLLLNAPT